MKKLLVSLFFVLLLLNPLFIRLSFAQEVASESAKNNYQLPYPGLLPDNPLYFFKTLRDKIEDFLISDPLIKASFDLSNADKRLSTGLALFEKKKYELTESTISKGENYFEEGIKNLEQSRREGRQIDPSLIVAYDSSARKHKEILEGLVVMSKGGTKKLLEKQLDRVTRFIVLVNKLKL